MRRRNQFAHRSVDLLRLNFARQHFCNQTVDGGIVVAADNGQFNVASLDDGPERSRQINCHPATTQTNNPSWFFHGSFAWLPAKSLGFVSLAAGSLGVAIRRGKRNSPARPFKPRSLNKWRKAFGPATLASACTAGLR